MLWIKRNLLLALGGFVAIGLLGFGVYFFLGAQSRNAQLEEEIGKTTNDLTALYKAKFFPSATNTATAKRETEKLRGVLTEMRKLFSPVQAEKVTGLAFRSYRDNTLAELHRLAEQSRTTLPPKYAFTFETQKNKVEFKEGTFPAIPQQMAEVKALCKILFDAHVDPLVNLRRARVSRDDDESSVATDYLLSKLETNAAMGTVTSPYEVTFHCLSSELAAVLQGFGRSSHGFVVKALHVEPAVEAAAGPGGAAPGAPLPAAPRRFQNPTPPVTAPPPGQPLLQNQNRVAAPPAVVPPANRAVGGDKPIVLLKERRLKVTMLIHTIKALK